MGLRGENGIAGENSPENCMIEMIFRINVNHEVRGNALNEQSFQTAVRGNDDWFWKRGVEQGESCIERRSRANHNCEECSPRDFQSSGTRSLK